MQISTDILSLVMPRTQSDMGVRQRAGPSAKESFRFDKVFEEAMSEAKPQKTGVYKPTEPAGDKNDAGAPPRKSDDGTDENLAAGIIGNQEPVVFILEGDMESATAPETGDVVIFDAGAPFADDAGHPVESDPGTDSRPYPADGGRSAVRAEALPERDEPAAPDVAAESGVRIETNPDTAASRPAAQAQDTAQSAAPSAADQVRKTVRSDIIAEKTDTGNDDNAEEGVVTARMPIERTSERQENETNGFEFSGNGDLSPLENENETVTEKGQKEKTYSETQDAARGKAAAAHEPAAHTPPLANDIRPEQFRADQEMAQVTRSEPVRTENLFDEMVSRIETMHTESASTMTIQLKPEFLGKVALEIAMDAAGLHVRINAADSDVRAVINGQINALIESLGNKGIEVAEVEVAYTGVDNGAFKESREDHAQPDRPRKPSRMAERIDGAAYYAALPPIETLDYYIDAGISSVEYSA